MTANYVVLGAGGGIATATAKRLVDTGNRVLLAGRNDNLSLLAVELNQPSEYVDATKPDEVEACFALAEKQFGRIDGVLHGVGSILLKPAHLTSDEEWHATMAANLHSSFYVLRSAAKRMQATGGGSIVFFSSAAARIGLANHEAIAAAKAGVQGLVLSASATYANKNIRVNGIAPGLVKTNLASRLTSNEASLKASMAMHPLGRVGEAEDVASCAAWLLDPANTWVTGQIIGVDGGLGSVRSRG